MLHSRKRLRRGLQRRRQPLSDVLTVIFGYMADADRAGHPQPKCKSLVRQLRMMQPLTAVCHSWREALLPMFYHSVVCDINEVPPDKAGGKGRRCAPSHSWCTNLGLMLGGGYEHHARQLIIALTGDVAPDLPAAVLAEQGFDSRKWMGISVLRMERWHGKIARNPTYCAESLTRLNSYLLHALPGLSSVAYMSPDDRRYYREFPLDGLLASTLSRLTSVNLQTKLIPDLGSTAFLPALTLLTLKGPMLAGAAHLPMVFAESLEALHIGFTSADSIWDRFYSAGGAGELCFKRLKSLVLEYNEPSDTQARPLRPAKAATGLYDDCYSGYTEGYSVYNDVEPQGRGGGELLGGSSTNGCGEDGNGSGDGDDFDDETLLDPMSPTRLLFYKRRSASEHAWPAFPELQSLSVCKYPDEITHVLRQFAVARIPSISIRDVKAGWASIHPTTVAGLLSLRVHISSSDTEFKRKEHRYQAWVNRLFSVTSPMESLHLDAPAVMPITLPDVIGLTRLRSLSLSFRVDLGVIPNLLSRLPCLQRLAMHVHPWSSWARRNQGIIGRGDYELLAAMPLLSRSLASLVAYVGPESDDDPAGVERELAWILARSPALRSFMTEKHTRDAVRIHVDEILACVAGPCVRHLASMKMNVWSY